MKWPRDRSYFGEMAIICSLAIAPGENLLYAQPAQPNPAPGGQQGQSFSPEQLDSLVSPIALYPDPLLGQVLAASTYPLEIVTAERWAQRNSNLTGKALMEAAGKQDWDPSVQALIPFPTVLQMLNQNLDWTTALGNAFLAQQADVMAAVQRLRIKAQQSGKLESSAQQQVQTTTVDGAPAVVIQPTDPEVVYVPAYDPAWAYGAAPPYYPYPAVSYPSGIVAASAISFGVGVAVGAIFSGGGWGWGCNWGAHPSLYVNNNFFNSNRNTFVNRGNWGNSYAGAGRAGWNHNPRYRGAVPYPNRDVASRFNGPNGGLRPAQLPANMGNIRPPVGQGSANRLPGNIGQNADGARSGAMPSSPASGAAGRGGIQAPSNARGSRPATGAITPGQTGSANRAAPGGGGQWGGWSGSKATADRGGAFGGGSAGQARQFSDRGARSMGGGGARRGGGGRRR